MDPRRLREETRAEHELTESLMPLGGAELTRELYVRVLQVLEPLVRSWETWSADAAPEAWRKVLAARQRSHLLRADLRTLGAGPGPVAAEADWTGITAGGQGSVSREEAEAMFVGAVYVMEGSTLGGRFIARHVENVLALEPGQGALYFQGHGEATGAMWREVTARIAAVPEEFSGAVVEGARRAFRVFGDALRAGNVASIPERS